MQSIIRFNCFLVLCVLVLWGVFVLFVWVGRRVMCGELRCASRLRTVPLGTGDVSAHPCAQPVPIWPGVNVSPPPKGVAVQNAAATVSDVFL